jgi:hypothetical protein
MAMLFIFIWCLSILLICMQCYSTSMWQVGASVKMQHHDIKSVNLASKWTTITRNLEKDGEIKLTRKWATHFSLLTQEFRGRRRKQVSVSAGLVWPLVSSGYSCCSRPLDNLSFTFSHILILWLPTLNEWKENKFKK